MSTWNEPLDEPPEPDAWSAHSESQSNAYAATHRRTQWGWHGGVTQGWGRRAARAGGFKRKARRRLVSR